MPNRSSSCGRSSPSSGLPLPTRMKRAGWLMLIPSRSTVFQPEAAESSSTSTKWSSSRLTSSTYRMPRLAFASRPGSKAFTPSVKAFSMSMVPHTRSSVAPRGKSIMGIFMDSTGSCSPALRRMRISSLMTSGSEGSELKASLATTWISGSKSARARMVVDFPVPLSPMIITPPILGSITFRIKDSFISSWPTMAVNGKMGRAAPSALLGASVAAALLTCRAARWACWPLMSFTRAGREGRAACCVALSCAGIIIVRGLAEARSPLPCICCVPALSIMLLAINSKSAPTTAKKQLRPRRSWKQRKKQSRNKAI
mmetsp:Transcript_19820/g.51518  ORF Transcript_19820/g.51518 Transcript_19820/m.51518 type:complete len:313 (+) Transcript_19820:3598-4536(+)